MALREILVEFGVSVDAADLEKFDEKLEKVIDKLGKFGLTVATFMGAKAFTGFIAEQIEAGFQLERTSEKLGITTDALQELRYSANLAGESTDKFDRAIRFMLKNQGKAEVGLTAGVKEWNRLGLSVKNADGTFVSVEEQLVRASDALIAMPSAAQKTRAAIALFGVAGAEVLPWLLKGGEAIRAQFADYRKLGGGMSESYIEKAKEAARQTRRVDAAMASFKATVSERFLPTAARFLETMVEWTLKAKDVAERTNLIQTAVQFLETFLAARAIRTVLRFAASLTLASLGSLAVVAGIGLLFLLVEDLSIALEGGKSVIGEYFEEYLGHEKAKESLDEIKGAWDRLKAAWDQATPSLKELGKALFLAFDASLPTIINGFTFAIGALEMSVKILIGTLATAYHHLNAMRYLMSGDLVSAGKEWGAAGTAIDKTGNSVMEKGSIFDGWTQGGANIVKGDAAYFEALNHPEIDPSRDYSKAPAFAARPNVMGPTPGPWAGGMGSGQVTVHNEANIVINGAQDPKSVAREVSQSRSDLASQSAASMSMVEAP